MMSILQVSHGLCGLVLLGMSHATSAAVWAADDTTVNQSHRKLSDGTTSRTIKGDVLRIEYADYFSKEKDGKEVRVHTDKTTQMMGQLKQGDRIEAEIVGENHALWIRAFPQLSKFWSEVDHSVVLKNIISVQENRR